MKDGKDLITGVATLLELGCIAALAGIALKRNNDCYKAECKLIDTELKLIGEQISGSIKNFKISMLEKELDELKKENVEEEEES